MKALTTKEKYKLLCEEENNIPLFIQYWWMEAVCGDKWDVLFYEENNVIIGIWVYHYKIKLGKKFIIQPRFTQSSGIWIKYPNNIQEMEKLGLEKKIISNLITKINKTNFFYLDIHLNPQYTNWLPFYWNGFSQTTRYSYQLKNISNLNECFGKFDNSKRNWIKKAKKNNLSIHYDLSLEKFYELHKKSIEDYGSKILFNLNTFKNLVEACTEKKQGQILAIKDNDNIVHSAIFVAWDENIGYNLITLICKDFRSSGASSLMFLEAISFLSDKTKIFDFEGSMDENIEASFRKFGASQIPYFRIIKTKSKFLKLLLEK